jgi:hypothetical protein
MSRRNLSDRYWDAYAASLEPPTGSAARNLARIHQRARAGEPVEDVSPSAADRPRRAAAGGVVLLGKSAAASVGIATATLLSIKLAVVGWSQLAGTTPAATEAATEPAGAVARAQAVAPSRADEPPPKAIEPEVADGLAEPSTADAPRPVDPSRRGQSPAIADRLRAEVALMDRARAALERDDSEALWRLTSEHARRFPAGALVEEREAWQALAACRLGHAHAAAHADRFLRAYPRSAQAGKVRRACESALENR